MQISEWMGDKGICKFTATEHAVQLDLIGRVHGYLLAENYFSSLPDEHKTEKTYGALLNCYVRQRQLDMSLSHFQKMKEMGFASLTYNIMCLFTNIGQYEKVPEVLAEMKANKVLPDNYSYRLCVNTYRARSDIEALGDILKEAETQPHMAVDWNTYIVAANFCMKAGFTDKAIYALRRQKMEDEILRLWELEKNACKRCLNWDYVTLLESLVRIGAVELAEKVLNDWKASNNCYDFRVPNIVIAAFIENGMFERAEEMLKSEKQKGSSPNTWGLLGARYEEKGDMHKAMNLMMEGLSLFVEDKVWKPNKRVIDSLLNWAVDHGSVEDVDSFVKLLRNVIPVNKQMCYALMKARVRNGLYLDSYLEKLKADKLVECGEMEKMIKMVKKKIPLSEGTIAS